MKNIVIHQKKTKIIFSVKRRIKKWKKAIPKFQISFLAKCFGCKLKAATFKMILQAKKVTGFFKDTYNWFLSSEFFCKIGLT